NSASSSTAATARPRRAGPSPSAVGAAGAPSTRRLVVGVRGSPAPTPAACESWTAVSERGSQAISPYPVNSGSVSPTARQSLRTSFQEGQVLRESRVAGIARFAVASTTPDPCDAVMRQAPILNLASDEETEGFLVHRGLAGSGGREHTPNPPA